MIQWFYEICPNCNFGNEGVIEMNLEHRETKCMKCGEPIMICSRCDDYCDKKSLGGKVFRCHRQKDQVRLRTPKGVKLS